MRKLTLKQTQLIRRTVIESCNKLVAIERRLHDAVLHATAARINFATQKLGWEAAALLERAAK